MTPFVPPSPNAIGHIYTPPVPLLDVEFDKPMDQAVVPAAASFEIVLDGVPETPAGLAWTDATHLQFGFSGPPAVSGVWNQLSPDLNLRGTNGSYVKLPQTQTWHP